MRHSSLLLSPTPPPAHAGTFQWPHVNAAPPKPASQVKLAAARRHWQRGCLLGRRGQWQQAVQAFEKSVAAVPRDALYWSNLGNAYRHVANFEAAAQAATHSLRLSPGDPVATHLLGESLARLHRYAEAADCLAGLEAAGSTDTSAMLQHACMLRALQRPQDAVPVLLRALSLQPHLTRAHALLAEALRNMGLKREAVECMKTVLALEPGNLEALSHLSFEKRHLVDWSGWQADINHIEQALQQALQSSEGQAAPRQAAVFGLLSLPLRAELQLLAARGEAAVSQVEVSPLQRLPRLSRLPRLKAPHVQIQPARMRVGWLSFDFREHPVSQLLVQSLEELDRLRFEIFLYSSGPDDGSLLRHRVQASGDHFVDLRGLSDAQAAERIRADGVELLIDLCGHTRGQRMGILAYRPAPVQAAYLGYPGSTGASFIDYVVGDPFVTPLAHAAHYSEKLAQLPMCLQPNGRWRPLPQPMSRSQAGLPDSAFVMCAFNHTYKIGPQALDRWCDVMRESPSAVLWLKQTNSQMQGNLLQEVQARGVASNRVVFADKVPYEQHFSRLALADVFVDTWPYNAHTTASDALWAGLPVVTLYGQTYASRVAASVLQAAGLAELAFDNADDYGLALRAMALEPALLQPYRQHLQEHRMHLPLFDCAQHTLALQQLFERMVGRWRAGLAPEHLIAASPPTNRHTPGAGAGP